MMLTVKDLTIGFHEQGELETVVKQVSFTMDEGEILGIVGESGSGKTMTALTIAGLLKKHAVLEDGRITLAEQELLTLSEKEWRQIRGNEISMIFQEPMTALNPTMKVGRQVEEALKVHTGMKPGERKAAAYEMMREVELSDVERLYQKYPHELSGGMRQRIMIAAALICKPRLLIADEPTTALDAETREQVLALLLKLNRKYQMGILLISHDLKVVERFADRVLVMKAGAIVEEGETSAVLKQPQHAYTKKLIAAIPAAVKESLEYEMIGNRTEV